MLNLVENWTSAEGECTGKNRRPRAQELKRPEETQVTKKRCRKITKRHKRTKEMQHQQKEIENEQKVKLYSQEQTKLQVQNLFSKCREESWLKTKQSSECLLQKGRELRTNQNKINQQTDVKIIRETNFIRLTCFQTLENIPK